MTTDRAREAAKAYIGAINEGDLEALIALFRADATLTHPFGVYSGHEQLREFYGDMVLPAQTKLTVHRRVSEAALCVIEVSALSPLAPETPQFAIDLFEVDGDGKISDLRVYYRNFDLG